MKKMTAYNVLRDSSWKKANAKQELINVQIILRNFLVALTVFLDTFWTKITPVWVHFPWSVGIKIVFNLTMKNVRNVQMAIS